MDIPAEIKKLENQFATLQQQTAQLEQRRVLLIKEMLRIEGEIRGFKRLEEPSGI